jgi:hypothetical protein
MTGEDGATDEIQRFAAVINSRLAAESLVARAKAFGWLCTGAAIAVCLAGAGCAIALFGYGHMLSVKPAAEMTARALADSLQRTKIKTIVSGRMTLSPESELKLAPGQTVRLNEGAIVKLDPNSSVRVIGNLKVDVPQPSKQQLQLEATTKTDELPFTNYTIFRDVNYEKGHVVTGWNYDLSDAARPKVQYCYYQQTVEKGLSAKYMLAVNDYPRTPSALTKVSFNFEGALANCIWFSGY